MLNKNMTNNQFGDSPFSLILITILFSVLLTVTIFLINLKILARASFLKSILRQADVYQTATETLRQRFLENLVFEPDTSSLTREDIKEKLSKSLQASWFQEEVERNIDELSNYINGDNQEVSLNFDLSPVKGKIAEQFYQSNQTGAEQVEEKLPRKVDLFGENGLFDNNLLGLFSQLRITSQAISLIFKVLVFILFLTLASFFLIESPALAFRWVGIAFLFGGLTVFILANLFKKVFSVSLLNYLTQREGLSQGTGNMAGRLIDLSSSAYLDLINWQSIIFCLLGLLILLIALVFSSK